MQKSTYKFTLFMQMSTYNLTLSTISKMERVKKKINMPIELDGKGKLQYKIFQIYPDYHDLEDNKKEEILSALIQWACMEIYKLKEQ